MAQRISNLLEFDERTQVTVVLKANRRCWTVQPFNIPRKTFKHTGEDTQKAAMFKLGGGVIVLEEREYLACFQHLSSHLPHRS